MPLTRAPPSRPNHLLKAPLPNSTTLSIRFQHTNGGEHRHSVCISVRGDDLLDVSTQEVGHVASWITQLEISGEMAVVVVVVLVVVVCVCMVVLGAL